MSVDFVLVKILAIKCACDNCSCQHQGEYCAEIYFSGEYQGQALRDRLNAHKVEEISEPDQTPHFAAMMALNHNSEVVTDLTFAPVSTTLLSD